MDCTYLCTNIQECFTGKSNCFLSSYKPHQLQIIKYIIEVKWEGSKRRSVVATITGLARAVQPTNANFLPVNFFTNPTAGGSQ